MFRYRWKILRLAGIPIYIDASWLIIAALITFSLANLFADRALWAQVGITLETTRPMSYFWGALTALGFFVCIVLHELGHAVASQRMHMPVRGITLFLFGGVAEMTEEPPSAKKEFIMAIAGPAVSVVLAAAFWGLFAFGLNAGWMIELVVFLLLLAWINTVVLIFNMVPAFPLDGGRVLRSALWAGTGNLRKATYWASLAGQAFAWVLIGYGIFRFFAWGDIFGGLWMGLIGLFLNSAARQSYQQVVLRQMLEGEPVRRFMNPSPVTVAPGLSLREWVEDYVYRHHHKTYPVVSDGQLEGVVSTAVLSGVPRGEWDTHAVSEFMRQDIDRFSIRPDTDALDALKQMQRTGSSRLLVREGGRLAGIVSLKDLLRFFQLKLELENEDEAVADYGPRHDWPRAGQRETEVRP